MTAAGCNPSGYVKVDVFQDLFKNNPPTLSSFTCASTSLTEGDTLSCSAIGNDTGDFTYRFSLQNTCGSAVIDADSGVINLLTDNSFVPGCVLSIEAFDGEFTSSSIQVPITVANTVPTLSISDVTLPEDSVLIANDAAVQSSEGDNGVYALDNAVTTGTKCSTVGTLSIDAVTGAVSLNAPNWVGSCNITVTYDDGNGGVATDEFTYTATNINDGPIISGSCGGSVNQDAAYSCSALTANDPEGDTFTWEFGPTHDCAFLAIDSSTGAITGTPDDNEVGSCTLAVRGTDGTNYSQIVYTRSITVNNLQPTLNITNKSTNDTIGPVVVATDAEVQSNEEGLGVYALDNATTSGTKCSDNGVVSINTTNGEVTFDGVDGWTGTCNIKVVFDDQNPTLNLVADEFTLTVVDNVGPVALSVSSLLADGTYNLGSTISIRVTFNEPVTVTGFPKILLETGFIDREATYVSGSGSANLTFNYTVEADDFSADLDVAAAAVIVLNGGTLVDISSNAATLNLPAGANPNSLPSQKNIVVAGTFPFAELQNIPTPIARTSLTDMTVGGTGVTHYRYKWGIKAATDCSVATGYSAETDISQKIVESLTSVVVGNPVAFCVVGKNASDVWQPYSAATRVEWIKGEYSMGPISLAGLSNLPNWKDVIIDSFGRIVARNARGEIFRSVDNGTTWQLQCKIVNDDNAHFKTSPTAGHTYLITNGNLHKVESYNGAPCPQKTSTITDFNYTYFYSPIAIDSDGSIYLFLADASGQRDLLYKSADQGENWILHNTLTGNGWSSSFAIDPNDKNKMVRFAADDVNSTRQGLYTSSNAGITWTMTSTKDLTFVDLKYNPAQSNSFYVATGDYSTDGGVNLTLGTNTILVTDSRRFHIDTDGSGYFLQESGVNTLLRKSTNYGIAAHSVLYTFPNISSNKNSQAISTRGPLIAAVMGGRLYVSTNSGSSFNLINWQGTKLALMTGITTKDGKTVYGVTADWNIVKSSDIGETWSLKYTNGRGCFSKEPRIDTHELEANRFSVWANGSNCGQYASSIDGGNTVSTGLLALNQSFQSHVYNPLDSNFEGFRAQAYYRQTNDGGYDWKAFNNFPSTMATNPDAFHDSQNGNKQWLVDTSSFGSVVVTNLATITQSTVATGLATVAGMDAFVNDAGVFEVRVIDRTGKIRRSLDQGATFSDLGVAPGLPICTVRYFYSLPQNRNVMATICANGDDLTFTTNNGQTWRTIDFDGLYGINCDASAVALHPNKFFVACKSYDVLYVKYNAIELINDVTDSILSNADHGLGRPIVNNTIANEFASTEYAIIPLNGTCDGSLTFSPSVPLSNDPAFSSTGDYQVCVRLTDASSVVTFDRSPIISFDSSVPAAPTFNLAGALSDALLKRHEFMDDGNPVVTGISGSGFDNSSFAIIPAAGICNSSHRYSFSQPIGTLANQFVSISPGSWKVCMKLSDRAGNGEVYTQSPTFTYSDATVYSKLVNLPSPISNILNLNINVTGTNVSSYRYKVGQSSNTNCAAGAGYSSPVSSANPITDSLVTFKPSTIEQATQLKICVVGSDASGNWQAFKEATMYEWSLFRYSAEKIVVGNASEVENWKSGWVDLHDHSIFYATDYSGMVYKSNNGGASWSGLCRIPISANSLVYGDMAYVQSHYADRTLYVPMYGDVYKVQDLGGIDCLNVTADLPYISTNAANVNFSIGPSGVLYAQTLDGGEQRDSIYKSTNGGLSWTRTGGGIIYIESYTPSISMRPDPNVPGRLFATFVEPSRPDMYGVYRSDDDGANWTKLQTSTGRLFLTPALQTPGKWSAFNAMAPSTGLCTTNDWVTSNTCTRYSADTPSNTQNQGRFQSLNGDIFSTTSMYWATNMPSYMLKKYQAGDNSSTVDVALVPPVPLSSNFPLYAIQGSSYIATAVGRMYISTNGGASFTKIPAANPENFPLLLEGAKNGSKNLMVMPPTSYLGGHKKVFMSQDFGESWVAHADPNDRCYQNTLAAMGDLDHSRFSAFVSTSCATDNFNSFTDSYVTKSTLVGIEGKAVDISNPQEGFLFGNYYMAKTSSYWQHYDYKNFVMPFIAPSTVFKLHPEGYVDPRDSNRFFALTVNQNGDVNYPIRLSLVDYGAGTWTNLTPNTNLPVPSSLALAHDGSGGHYLYVIASDGRLERSTDYGASFSVINSNTMTSGSSCNSNRKYYVDPDKPQYQQTSCSGEYFSINGGLNFNRILSSFQTDRSFDGCIIVPKYFDGKHIYVRCALGLMKLKLSDFDLWTSQNDRNLDANEQGMDLPLVQVTEPGQYSSISYAVVGANVTCDNSLTYSASIPTTTDPAFTTSGKYKVCVKYNDGSVKFAETSYLNFTSGAAVFTSVALANDVADGVLTENEKQDSHLPLLKNLVASNYNSIVYQVAVSGANCSTLTDYKTHPPLANLEGHELSMSDGNSYKVCLKLRNHSGAVYGSSPSFTYEENFPHAELVAELGLVEKNINITSAVSGLDLTTYKYKFGRAEFLQCASDTNYSSEVSVATQITLPLATAELDKQYKLCLVGKNSANEWQPLHLATEYSFFVNKFRITAFSPGSFNIGNWIDMAIHETDPNYMALMSHSGHVYRTRDGGVTWNVLCKIAENVTFTNNQRYKLLIANDGPKTIYTSSSFSSGGSYRVEDRGGDSCTKVSRHHIALDSVGRVYSVSGSLDSSNPTGAYRSADQGRSWVRLLSLSSTVLDGVIHVNRNNDDNILVVNDSSTGSMFVTNDGGLNWTSRGSLGGFLRTQSLISSPTLANTFFQPLNGVYTTDGGATSASLIGAINFRGDGRAYRLRVVSDAETVLETNTDVFNSGTWTTVYTFNGFGHNNYDNLVVSGNTIAVIFARRLYLSTNGGATFAVQNISMNRFAFNSFERTATKIYGLTNSNAIFASSDNGVSWNFISQIENDVGLAKTFMLPSTGNGQLIVATNNYIHTSSDEFNTNKTRHSRVTLSFCFYENVAQANQMLLGTQNGHVATTDGYVTNSVSAESITNTCYSEPRLYMNPADPNFIINTSWSTFVVYNMTTNTSVPFVTGLPNTISDIEMYEDGGNYVLRAIDTRGTIRESLNFGTTFSPVGAINPYASSDSLSNSKMNSEITDRNFILNHTGQNLAYTFDGGNTWETQIKTANMQGVLKCTAMNDVIPFKVGGVQKAIASCSSDTEAGRALIIEF